MPALFNQHPKTYVSSAQIPGFPHFLKATVHVLCPKCQQEANLGDLQGGGALVKCEGCGHTEKLPGTNSAEIAKAFFAQVSQ